MIAPLAGDPTPIVWGGFAVTLFFVFSLAVGKGASSVSTFPRGESAGRAGGHSYCSPMFKALGNLPANPNVPQIALASRRNKNVFRIWAQNADRAGRNRPARADAETGRKHTMNILLWVLQVLAALLYGASGVMKVFIFDKVSEGVPSFGALPREAWKALGIVELVCTVGLIVPGALGWQPALTVVAATVLAIESLVFIGVHVKYREITPIIMSGVLGLLMAFIAFGRMVLKPIL